MDQTNNNEKLKWQKSEEEPLEIEAPPILGTWPKFYAVVLIFEVVLVLLFYIITKAFA